MLWSINGFVDGEARDLPGGVFREFRIAEFHLSNGLVGDILLVDLLDRLLKVGLRVGDVMELQSVGVGRMPTVGDGIAIGDSVRRRSRSFRAYRGNALSHRGGNFSFGF